jgi:hypothetical protein
MKQLSTVVLIRTGGGVESNRHVGHFCLIVPVKGDCEDGEFGGMKIGRGNRSTRRKLATALLCPPQIPLDQTRARTRAAATNRFSYGAACSVPLVQVILVCRMLEIGQWRA